MTYSVYQHWDPLKVCIVGRSYSPKFYQFIKNIKVRTVMEQIAQETEEDYQKLINKLKEFGVEILRPNVVDDYKFYIEEDGKIRPPPMTPRDYSIMLGSNFFLHTFCGENNTACIPSLSNNLIEKLNDVDRMTWKDVVEHIGKSNPIYIDVPKYLENFGAAMTTRIGKDIYVGTDHYSEDLSDKISNLSQQFSEYRWHGINTGGHSDGTYCPVCPGLIISLADVPTYADTFPGWEVVYLPNQGWSAVKPFLQLKEKNKGKWWVPGEELNDDFTDFVESWLEHWTGYVEETVFDVNMLIIDPKNVICNNYNKQVFDALERYGVTPHIINFRHRYFWDGGIHCITSDVHRQGTMQDYFKERN